MDIFTIGHSVHSEDEFIQLLRDANITSLVDVRAFPGSRKFPHFLKERMKAWLPEADIAYEHIEELGGRKNKSKTVDTNVNSAWENQSFHNYADYTLSDEFKLGLGKLKKIAADHRVAYCCSERHPARCHRLLISNWLSLNGWSVKHILNDSKNKIEIVDHPLGKWGANPVLREDGSVTYPK